MRECFCPVCEAIRTVEFGSRAETLPVRGVDVEIEAEFSRCTVCGEEFADAESMDRTLQAAYAGYRHKLGILSPDEIRAIRARYGVSQKAFGLILGFGELTINSYESGSLPTEANNNLIKLVRHPETFKELFGSNKDKIGPTQRKRIETALTCAEASAKKPECVAERAPGYGCEEPRASEFTGFMQPDKKKLFRLIVAVLFLSGAKLYKTQINKLLFYSEFAHFRDRTVPISGWPFAAIDYGPVPDDFQILLGEGEKEGFFRSEPDSTQLGELFSIAEGVNPGTITDSFSDAELATIKTVVAKLGRKSASELTRLSHAERAWKETPRAKRISYEFAKDIVAV
ncbi:MAG: hypothetical protein A2Z99_03180 [Treponema sp. GWB1_62_6]|nr:MAG: hypothetical protein A2001_14040 [Treponema sp. GWC1_61_84]OHE67814.1 MAG: hypothetical protein A2Z99_03180 [Treponema sp. GWB1_62_6]OHE75314.1 MAG: hypothetical protein A2413_08675 [Treponema sp. RIFOXYC1_FULL_61_9]